METDRTDLLPVERRRRLHREYLFRLATVMVLMGALLFAVAAGLLVPTHMLLSREVAARKAQLASVEAVLTSTADAALSKQLDVFKSDIATLAALKSAPKATGVMQNALSVPRPGISLTGFSYTPLAGSHAGMLNITGVAKDRASLQAYQTAIQAATFATNADLPVSAYAKSSNIAFTIAVTLAL